MFLVVVLLLGGAAVAVLAFVGTWTKKVDSPQTATSATINQPMRPFAGPKAAGPARPGPVAQPPVAPVQQQRRLQVGETAPEIEGNDLDGKAMKLSDFRGKVVVLDFWGDWCPFCKAAYTYQRQLVRRMEGRSSSC